MQFLDLLAKIAGLDQSKEYDIVESSTVEQNGGQGSLLTEHLTDPSLNTEETDASKDVLVQQLMNQNATNEKMIAELKAMNLALLSRTPAESTNEKSVEQMIYECVYGIEKGNEV